MEQRQPNDGIPAASDHLDRGRRHYERRAWADAFDTLRLADRAAPLETDDLERLAMAAFLIGREKEYLGVLDRIHRACLGAELWTQAARSAFWIGLCHLFRGEMGAATGWFGRAQRAIDRGGCDCAEQGYLLLPVVEQHLAAADSRLAFDAATKAAEIGERFADVDLVACARHLQGRALLKHGQVERGLALLDEAMLPAVEGELSPRMTGLIYCSVIEKCMQVYAYDRAREWTSMLSSWCGEQPQLVSFTGKCLVHRAEILQLQGNWTGAFREAHRACAGFPAEIEQSPPSAAFYRRAELHRLLGEFAAAEEAYLEASRRGCEPQPGLALLRMAEGRVDVSAVAIRRALAAVTDPLRRTQLQSAAVEIMLGAGDLEAARGACSELEELARTLGAEVPLAMSAYARGSLELSEGNAAAALCPLRHAFEFWHRTEAPYEAARARELLGSACRALGDEEGAEIELDAARATYTRLGAAPDLARVATMASTPNLPQTHGLTKRELQVLRLVAAGKTNKEVACELCVSRRTVDRHVSNLFGKLGVSTRAAATAHAHQHKLV